MRSLRALNKRLASRKAFTLAELLIVVAIVAVLVGISIPIFNAQLEKSREATDLANMRAAKALATDVMLSDINKSNCSNYGMKYWDNVLGDKNYVEYCGVYDVNKGKFSSLKVADFLKQNGCYGQGTASDGGSDYYGYDSKLDYSKAVVQVSIYPKGAGKLIYKFDSSFDSKYESTPCIIIQWKQGNNNSDFIRPAGKERYGQITFVS